ncbi:hypothetical protein GCM10010149_57190 [Nonomuraea roseoviolacea subsp. roseoviolacea]|uniref:hypothetical protein n=1 Tax=Nonomuraea roseoviolacea TaxID=103837 RepID=UPI0031DB797A
MSDRIACPECEGRKGLRIGDLFLSCQFCGGLGWVGDTNEPAERSGTPPAGPSPVWQHRVWSDPYVASQLDCRYCLGSRHITSIDEEAGTMRTISCVCAPSS